jgi:hypothetical protein
VGHGGVPLVVAGSALAALAAWYGLFAVDNYSSFSGRSWKLFKLCKWAFPIMVSLQAAGLAELRLERSRIGRLAASMLGIMLFAVFFRMHSRGLRACAATLIASGQSTSAYHDAERLQRRAAQEPGRFYILATPRESTQNLFLAASLVYPSPVDCLDSNLRGLDDRPATVVFRPLLNQRGERFGFGFASLDDD